LRPRNEFTIASSAVTCLIDGDGSSLSRLCLSAISEENSFMTDVKLTPINDWQPGRRYPYNHQQEREWHPDIIEEEFWKIAESIWDYSVCATAALYNFYTALRYVFDQKIEGEIIECGVFFGGTIMFAAKVMKMFDYSALRRLLAMDTFTGFARRDEKLDVDYSGNDVIEPTKDNNGEGFFKVSSDNMSSVGFERLEIIKGDVKNTISNLSVEKNCYT